MTRFTYTAKDAAGHHRRGTVEATGREAAISALVDRFEAILDIREQAAGGLNAEIKIPGVGGGHIKPKTLAVICRQLSTTIGAGLPLSEALRIVAEAPDVKPETAKALADVRQDVVGGSSLTIALAQHPKQFPQLLISLVAAGEASGELDRTLAAAAGAFEREHKLHAKIRSAMTYPTIVLAIAFIAVIGIVWKLVPQFESMFEALGGQLPVPTQILVNISHQMSWLGPLTIILVIASIAFVRSSREKPWFRSRWQPLLLKLPIVGQLARKLAVARFSDALALLVSVGVPLVQALDLAGSASGNWVVQNAARTIREEVEGGRGIGSAMKAQPVFPELTTQMVAAGEASGDLPVMLDKIAEFYNDDVTESTEQITSIIEPVMIVAIGLIIGGIVISLYLPIFQINTLISNS